MNGDLGTEINELLAHLNEITVPAHANADWAKIRNLQRRLDGRSSALQSAHQCRKALAEDRQWAESDIHGCERALVLVGGDEEQSTDGARKLQQRLTTHRSRVEELALEIEAIDERIRQIEEDLVNAQQILAMVLHRSINGAERKIHAAKVARQQRQRQHRIAMAVFDETPLWSPYAVMGYRIWTIKKDGLYGAWHRWTTPTMKATCDLGGDLPHIDGRCAEVAFGCGIYASKSPLELMKKTAGRSTDGFAVGLVGMEGTVVEHEYGYRAASATVLALAVAVEGALVAIDDPAELESIFVNIDNAGGLGTAYLPELRDVEPMREFITDYVEDQAQRRATWTSANPSE